MLNKLSIWEISGFIFVIIIGTILHFVYGWSGKKRMVGFFSPVNESTWEHLKLLFTPMLIFSLVEYFSVGQSFQSFIPAKVMGLFLGLLAIVASFYTYTGIIGAHFLWADILTFIFGVAVAFGYSWSFILNHQASNNEFNLVGIIFACLLLISFAVFTIRPPKISLFLDPVTKTYGRQSL